MDHGFKSQYPGLAAYAVPLSLACPGLAGDQPGQSSLLRTLVTSAQRVAVNSLNRALSSDVALRQAGPEDLGCINTLIAAAITTWDVTERVRRISLPLYQYRLHR